MCRTKRDLLTRLLPDRAGQLASVYPPPVTAITPNILFQKHIIVNRRDDLGSDPYEAVTALGRRPGLPSNSEGSLGAFAASFRGRIGMISPTINTENLKCMITPEITELPPTSFDSLYFISMPLGDC